MASKGPMSGTPVSAKPAAKFKAKQLANAPVAKPVVPEFTEMPVPAALAATTPASEAAPMIEAAPVIETAPAPEPAPVALASEPAQVALPAPAEASAPVITEQPTSTVAPAAEATQKEVVTMETVIENTAEQAQDQAKVLFADVNDRAKSAMEKGSKMVEDLKDFSKGNVEALVESSKIAARGVEMMSQEAAEYSRRQFESATATLKSLSTVKSPTELMKLHSDYVRGMFDAMVAETSKNTETMLKLAGEIAQPISNRVALAAEKMKIAA